MTLYTQLIYKVPRPSIVQGTICAVLQGLLYMITEADMRLVSN